MNKYRVLTCIFFLLTCDVFAADKAVVVTLKKNLNLDNTITVAKSGGDFSDPVTAVSGIHDASASNPYTVVIGPGVYALSKTLVMKPYVSVIGAGEQATRLTGSKSSGAIDPTSALVAMADNSSLSGLTVENKGGGVNAIGIYSEADQAEILGVTATASGGVNNAGVCNQSSTVILKDVTATASGGQISIGIYNNASPITMTNVTATASGGEESFALFNESSAPEMNRVVAAASGGSDNRGVNNIFSFPVMVNVTATASGGTSYGMYNDNSLVKVRTSTFNGGTHGIYSEGGAVSLVSLSTIIGGSGTGGGYNICTFTDNGTGWQLNSTCQ